MSTQNSVSKNWKKAKEFLRNLFAKNKKSSIKIVNQISTKHIDIPEPEETVKTSRRWISNNRQVTNGRSLQKILLFTDQLGHKHYKHIIHTY
jgi:hypothetical protein